MVFPELLNLADQKNIDLVPVQVDRGLYLFVLGVVVSFVILKINDIFAREGQLVVILGAHVHVLGEEF